MEPSRGEWGFRNVEIRAVSGAGEARDAAKGGRRDGRVTGGGDDEERSH